ncbi:MAG: LCP family protein [Streptosporangiales bacterium]|nr:LCP family protein [Streptosporangiales bacterium]
MSRFPGWQALTEKIGRQVLTAKAGYAAACVAAALVLITSGIAYAVQNGIGSIGGSDALTGGPQTGPMNILVMGLESRTDYQGHVLSSGLLTAMHAGSVYGVKNEGVGGQDTNTLILVHIFDHGSKAVGFSIPRNDYVTFPQAYDGQQRGMIDQAYGLAYTQSLSQTINQQGMSSAQRYLQANEAGQKATIQTVESVTGQKIDHFAEANLAGFYQLAQSFNGIQVCLKSWNGGENLHDTNSGFKAKEPGYQHLAAAQALAFVRERDNLPNGDLDRTRRQQSVIDYVMWKLQHQGVFTSADQLNNLMNTAKKYLITDQDWNLLDFASDMKALTGKNLQFETLPIKAYATVYPGGVSEAVNIIDVAAIQKEIKAAFAGAAQKSAGGPEAAHKAGGGAAKPKPKPSAATPSYSPSDSTVNVYNAGEQAGVAAQVMQGLVSKGYTQGETGNLTTQPTTQVLYGTGASAQANAAKVAKLFGVQPESSSSVSSGTIQVVLGSQSTPPASLTGGSGGSPSAQATLPSDATGVQNATANNGTNAPLKVTGNAKYGIPCVY